MDRKKYDGNIDAVRKFHIAQTYMTMKCNRKRNKKKRNSQSDLKKKVLLSTSYDSVSKCVDQMKSDIELFTLSISITCNHYYFENISKFFCHAAWHC